MNESGKERKTASSKEHEFMDCQPSSSGSNRRHYSKKGKHKTNKNSDAFSKEFSSNSLEGKGFCGEKGKNANFSSKSQSYVRQKSKERSYNRSLERFDSKSDGVSSTCNNRSSSPKERHKRRYSWIPFQWHLGQDGRQENSFRTNNFDANQSLREEGQAYSSPFTSKDKFLPSRKRQRTFISNKAESNLSSASITPPVRHIPGFYYDPEKKRYFKILPGHSNSGSSCITEETVKNIEAENTRKEMFFKKSKTKNKKGALHIHQSLQFGSMHPKEFIRESIDCRIRSLDVDPVNTIDLSSVLDYHVSGISNSDNIRYLELDRSQTKVLMVISNDAISRIHLGSVSKADSKFKQLQFDDWNSVTVIDTRKSAINTACLVNVDQQDISYPGNLYVLFSMSGEANNMVRLIKCPSYEEDVSYISYSMESKREIYHSCAWSNNPFLPAHLSVGLHLQAEVVDILSSNRIKLDTNQNEVYSQVFAKRSTVLYNGIKNGEILTFDLRASPRSWREHLHPMLQTRSLHHGGGVCSLKLLKDEEYLLAADFSGAIKLWDLRTRRVVQDIVGHHNEYKVLPLTLDQTESIVCAVGQDKHTRLWNLKTGSHLRTIPSPLPLTDTAIPSATFSMNWGRKTLPGVLVGAQRKLFWYPL